MSAFTTPILADGLSASLYLDGFFGSCGTSCSASGTFIDPDDTFQRTESATGIASFGHLFASTSARVQGLGENDAENIGFHCEATAEFTDTLTISLAEGGSGFISYYLAADIENQTDAGEQTGLILQQDGLPSAQDLLGIENFYGSIEYVTQPFAITSGIPFSLDLLAEAGTDGEGGQGTSFIYLSLEGISITDAQGRPEGYTVVSSSGTVYPAVPEPNSFVLLGLALAVVSLLHFRPKPENQVTIRR